MKPKRKVISIYISMPGGYGRSTYVNVRRKSKRMKWRVERKYYISPRSVALRYLSEMANYDKVSTHMQLQVFPTLFFERKETQS